MITTGDKTYFKDIGKIEFEGKGSDNPMAFKYYDENRMVGGKSMKDHFRFAIAYWHTFTGVGADPFGHLPSNFPCCKVQTRFRQPRTKLMPPLNLSPKLAHLTFAFQILI